jgi:hypothetical protein
LDLVPLNIKVKPLLLHCDFDPGAKHELPRVRSPLFTKVEKVTVLLVRVTVKEEEVPKTVPLLIVVLLGEGEGVRMRQAEELPMVVDEVTMNDPPAHEAGARG